MNIILIGMPGCGKSTLGVLLAKNQCKMFVDTDLIIQELEGCPLQEIINSNGLDYFLKSEEHAVCSLDLHNTVVATGGSVVYSEAAMAHLKKQGIIVYIKINRKLMESRLFNIKTRGVAIPKGMTLAEMYAERLPLYEKYADITVESGNSHIEDTLAEVMNLLEAAEHENN